MDLEAISTVAAWATIPLVIVGSLLHFAYDWSGHHRLVAVVGAVNESYWEHIKIAVWPVAACQVVLFVLGGYRIASFIPAATIALYSIPVGMVGLVFLYKHLVGRNLVPIDIAVFAVVVVVAQVLFVKVLQQLRPDGVMVALAALYLAGLVVSFLRFTLRPPREPDLFVDPLTGRYGVEGHTPPATDATDDR